MIDNILSAQRALSARTKLQLFAIFTSTMDSADMESQAHIGLWTNWSRGAIMGRTITLSRIHGNLLIAFTASFIAFVAARFWRIICVALHRYYSTSLPASTLHHQRQVVLRNSPSPESGLWSLITLCFAWRGTSLRRALGLMPGLCLAALIVVAFILAGGFSSTIASAAGDVVLLTGEQCGIPDMPTDMASLSSHIATLANYANTAAQYAQQCYSTDRSSLVDCGRFVKDRLSWEMDSNAPCPFATSMCRNNTGNLRLDTGHIDLNAALGMNVPENEGVSLRSVLHCAPLVTEGFTTRVSSPNATLVQYHYGNGIIGSLGNITETNYTHQVEDIDYQYQQMYSDEPRDIPNPNYQLE